MMDLFGVLGFYLQTLSQVWPWRILPPPWWMVVIVRRTVGAVLTPRLGISLMNRMYCQ